MSLHKSFPDARAPLCASASLRQNFFKPLIRAGFPGKKSLAFSKLHIKIEPFSHGSDPMTTTTRYTIKRK
jgi:hypothetical protein